MNHPCDIELTVLRFFNIRPSDLEGAGRPWNAKARLIFRYLLYSEGLSYGQVARKCNITRPAAYLSIQKVKGYLDVSDGYIAELLIIENMLNELK